jgi:hypothetical protein
MWLISTLYRNEYSNVKLAEATMGRRLRSRTGRDEPVWIIIHIGMETTQGISQYSYLYLKLAKHHVFLIIFCVFFFYKIREQEGRTGSN